MRTHILGKKETAKAHENSSLCHPPSPFARPASPAHQSPLHLLRPIMDVLGRLRQRGPHLPPHGGTGLRGAYNILRAPSVRGANLVRGRGVPRWGVVYSLPCWCVPPPFITLPHLMLRNPGSVGLVKIRV